jgi:hypothetical protein
MKTETIMQRVTDHPNAHEALPGAVKAALHSILQRAGRWRHALTAVAEQGDSEGEDRVAWPNPADGDSYADRRFEALMNGRSLE